jgi:succinoglycan biosynthesis transport protein ExoP
MAIENGSLFPEVVQVTRRRLPPLTRLPPPVDVDFAADPPHHLRDYLQVLYRRRRLALACFGATVAATVLFTLLTPRRYTAATRLELARQAAIQLRLEDSVRRSPDVDAAATPTYLATRIAALASRDLAERVIRRHRLDRSTTFLEPATKQPLEVAAGAELMPELRPRGLAFGTLDGDVDSIGPDRPLEPALIDRYMSFLSVRDVRGTDLIEVGFTTPSPSLSAFLVAAHTQAFMEANEDSQRASDVLAKDFLGRQIRESRKQIERAQSALDRFATENPQVAVNQEQKIVATRVGELSSLLTTVEAERTTLESQYDFLTNPKTEPLAYFLDRPGVQRLRVTLADIHARRAGLGQRLGPNHPEMQELAQLEAEINQQIKAEVTQAVAGVRAQYDASRLREERIRRKLGQQEDLGIELRGLGARYDLLQNDLHSAQNLHASLLKQRMETSVSSDLIASNLRVVERAEVPEHPSRPRTALNLMIGLLAGTLLGVGAAFGRDYFDPSVRSTDEMEDLLRLPTLATIPNFALAREVDARAPGSKLVAIGANGGRTNRTPPMLLGQDDLIVLHEPHSTAAEAFRSMRTAVLFSSHETPPKVVLVTSSRPAEGKTVGSLNLAGTLAESGARVLLVDADLRHPRCHALLRLANDRGLTSVLAGEAEIDGAIRPLDVPRLFFLPAGPPPRNPAELVGSPEMRRTLAALRERFDFVIIDTPPVLPVTDAVVLARLADGIVLVVKGHETPRQLVRRARDRLTLAGVNFLGVVVNNVDPGWGDAYFYDGYGTYGRSVFREDSDT